MVEIIALIICIFITKLGIQANSYEFIGIFVLAFGGFTLGRQFEYYRNKE